MHILLSLEFLSVTLPLVFGFSKSTINILLKSTPKDKTLKYSYLLKILISTLRYLIYLIFQLNASDCKH